MPPAITKPLALQDIARLYLGYLDYPSEAVVNIVSLRSRGYDYNYNTVLYHDSDLEKARKKYPTPEKFGEYLAHGQWNLECLEFAVTFTDEVIKKLDGNEKKAFMGENHPSRKKDNKVWEAMTAKASRTERVPFAHILLLLYNYVDIEPEIIHILLASKEGAESGEWNDDAEQQLELRILEAQEECDKRGENYRKAQDLAQYMVRGQMDIRDFIKVTSLTPKENGMIAHITDKLGPERHPFPIDSPADRLAAGMLADIELGIMPPSQTELRDYPKDEE